MNKKTPQEKKDNETKPDAKSPQRNKPPFKGLCINCEHRFTCTLPRPETGVWYCEEYE